MTTATTYELVLRGRAITRLLRPLLDASHLHGVLAHLTSVGVELVSVGPVARPATQPDHSPSDPKRGADA